MSVALSLRVLARLLGYPDAELRACLPEMREALRAERAFSESRLAELEKAKGSPIVVYGAGSDSDRAVKLLRKQGFEKAAGLEGGLKAWTEAGLPVES